LLCRIARHYGGWPHQIAHFPYHYWIALRNEYLAEMEAQAKAMKPPDDEEDIDFDKPVT
jgi:hypothetical protein